MMNTRSSAAIRAELTETTKAFNAAREDAITFERMKAAADAAAALAAKDSDLRAELLRAEQREDQERREAQYANIRNMRVRTSTGQVHSGSPLAAQYVITFERLAYSSSTRRNEWTATEVNGFASLAPDQFGYLVDKAADQIPAGIVALAPGEPRKAFDTYFLGMSRGHLRG
jgi:hypothetical protein